MSNEQHLTVEEAAERLSLHEETVRRWLRTGKLAGIRLGERRSGWRIPLSAVQAMLDASAAARSSPEESGRLHDPLAPEKSDLRWQAMALSMSLAPLITDAEVLLAASRVRGTGDDADHALKAVRLIKEADRQLGAIQGDPVKDPPELYDAFGTKE